MGLSINDYKQRQAFVEADPSYQLLEQDAKAASKASTDINHQRIQTLWKLRRLLIIRDIAINHAFQLEDASTEVSETLKTCTGDDSDDWSASVMTGCEELSELLYDLCGRIGVLNYGYKEAEKDRKEAWSVSGAKADELRKVWDAMQEAKEDN